MKVSILSIYQVDDSPERAKIMKAPPREQLNRLLLSETFERLGNVQIFIFGVGRMKGQKPLRH